MKTRDCKLGLLVIFLALCFAIYAGNCYSQLFGMNDMSYMNPLNALNQWDLGYSNQLDINYAFGTGAYYPSMQLFNCLWGCPFYSWIQPGGKATLDSLLDTIPNLNITYEAFYGVEYEPYGVALQSYYYINDNYGLLSPRLSNLNVYEDPTIYAQPLSQIHKLYNFTKKSPVQPIMPDIWVGYGGAMSLSY